jgi:hypothetical protein
MEKQKNMKAFVFGDGKPPSKCLYEDCNGTHFEADIHPDYQFVGYCLTRKREVFRSLIPVLATEKTSVSRMP